MRVGDSVRIRKDLVSDAVYGIDVFVPEMECYKGKVVTVRRVVGGMFHIEEDCGEWNWTPEMLEPPGIWTDKLEAEKHLELLLEIYAA